jgi:hypothetical protein
MIVRVPIRSMCVVTTSQQVKVVGIMVVLRAEVEMAEIKKGLLGECHNRGLTAGVAADLVKREI